eukprot:TRINITY_DN355_c0_g1_i1.p1 TRINITY_DN355_c0_g1~~TRINITY_DN355_c0_g1_i1.p1  ORF type:complete len:224 (-),score=50.99 TRINITY_DN355_c0_g1_i1:138-809(-)
MCIRDRVSTQSTWGISMWESRRLAITTFILLWMLYGLSTHLYTNKKECSSAGYYLVIIFTIVETIWFLLALIVFWMATRKDRSFFEVQDDTMQNCFDICYFISRIIFLIYIVYQFFKKKKDCSGVSIFYTLNVLIMVFLIILAICYGVSYFMGDKPHLVRLGFPPIRLSPRPTRLEESVLGTPPRIVGPILTPGGFIAPSVVSPPRTLASGPSIGPLVRVPTL